MSPERESRNYAARLALAAVFGLLAELALQSPLPILVPVLAIQLLAKGRPPPGLGEALKMVAGFAIVVWLVDASAGAAADRPAIFALILALLYFYAFVLSSYPRLAAIAGLMAVMAAVIPTVAVTSNDLAEEIGALFVIGIAKAVLVVWLAHAAFPASGKPQASKNLEAKGGIGWALLATLIITPLHLYFITSGEIVLVILISLTTLLAQGDSGMARKFALAALAANFMGATAASILASVIALRPHWLLLVLLTLVVTMLFAGRIARRDPAAPVFVMGLVTFIVLFGLTQTYPPFMTDVPIWSRLFAIAAGSAYALGLIAVFGPTEEKLATHGAELGKAVEPYS